MGSSGWRAAGEESRVFSLVVEHLHKDEWISGKRRRIESCWRKTEGKQPTQLLKRTVRA
jgi:hypothetical protein